MSSARSPSRTTRSDGCSRSSSQTCARGCSPRSCAVAPTAAPRTRSLSTAERLAATAERSLANVPLAAGGQQAFTTVSALGVDSGLVVGCHTSAEPGSEHACVERVLEMIDLRGAIVTMDAGNAHSKFCDLIRDGGGEWLACLKGNNARSVELCRRVFDAGVAREYSASETVDAARGDRRAVRVAKLDGAREAGHGTGQPDRELRERWSGAVCVVEVERERRSRTGQRTGDGSPKRSWRTVYYVCSQYLTAADAQRYIRSHWDVENRLHWTLDVSYGEDASRARSGYLAHNLATVRRLANNVLAAHTKSTSKLRHQMKFALDASWRDQVWGLV